ncbi:DedA family protein [Raineyella sp. LH-20]|uniref:DedA family protein n=1 Tax=Raineyella sp. LH-20 TaxID=3081204 RepID=UPI002952C9D4|nr:DedA family protein [Raineyella sp. LH-20]WOP17319.1 DedA family protein [Raineyella sp. LH-20]
MSDPAPEPVSRADEPATDEVAVDEAAVGEAVTDEAAEGETQDRPWWDDPSLPWSHEPTRRDLVCWSGIGLVGIYSLVMLPLRPVLLGYTPYVLAAVSGSRTAVVMIGALSATGDHWWWLGWLLATLSILKFDWVYFWAGKLWGRGLLEVMTGTSERARKRNERAERFALRWAVPAVLVTYLPIPLPAPIIYASVGAAGMSWRRFLVVDAVGAAVLQGVYLLLGHQLGEPAVRIVETYAKYSIWLSLVLLAVVIGGMLWGDRRRKAVRVAD